MGARDRFGPKSKIPAIAGIELPLNLLSKLSILRVIARFDAFLTTVTVDVGGAQRAGAESV